MTWNQRDSQPDSPPATARPAGRGQRGRVARGGLLALAIGLTAVTAACSGGGGNASSGSSPGSATGTSGYLAYSQCMRSHGVSNFPDPTSGGGFDLPDGMNAQSTQFVAADSACKRLLPAGQAPSSAQMAKIKSGNLNYARCMRAQGISDFPDPDSQGTLQVQVKPGSDLDPANPRFQAADRNCKHFQYSPPGGGGPSLTNGGS